MVTTNRPPSDYDHQNLMIAIGCLMNRLGITETFITYEEAQALSDMQLGTLAKNNQLYLELVQKPNKPKLADL